MLKTTNKQLEAALREAEEAGIRAKRSAAKAEAINNFLIHDLLTQASPRVNPRAREVTIKELLDRSAEKVGTAFARQPEYEASVRNMI
jgi:hypothetical protein